MRFSLLTPIFTGLLCALILISCKDSSTNGTENSIVEGLWKLISTEGDVSYVNITSSAVTFYDYQGDQMDQGDDCFIILSDQIKEKDGNIYTFEDPENPGETIDVEIIANDNKLTVKQPFGNGYVTIEFDRHSGNINDFTPECSEEVTAPSLSPRFYKGL